MNDGLTGQLNQGQGNFFESSQQPLGGGTLSLLLWITWVQTSQALSFSLQRTAHDKFGQGQNTQSQRQKPDQTLEMVFCVQVDRSQAQGATLEPGKISSDGGGLTISQIKHWF